MVNKRQRWLSGDFVLFDAISRWQPKDENKTSFTRIPTFLVNICLSFLTDEDLLCSCCTCSIFLRGLYKFYRGSKKKTEEDFRGILSVAKLGYVFSAITYLNIMLPYDSFDFKYLSPREFPLLKKLQLNFVCVNSLPTHPNVTFLRLNGCTFYAKKKRQKAKKFPFYNLTALEIDGGNNFTPDNPLPIFKRLKFLKIVGTLLSHPLTKRSLPTLESLKLRGIETVENCPNIRMPRLKKLTLDNAELLKINRTNLFFNITDLKLIQSSTSFSDIAIVNKRNAQ